MVRLSKIYTKKGDDGSTALGDGSRVSKTHPRIAAYGTADELGAVIGIAVAHTDDPELRARLLRIQNDLFDLGADLCVPSSPGSEAEGRLRITTEDVERIEADIDTLNSDLPPLDSFVLSGGTPAAAYLHLARTVARRCEREVIALARVESVDREVVRFLNRLSDYLFVLARHANRGGEEILWKPGGDKRRRDDEDGAAS